jgi:uroporphyrinogen decarboxylase
MKNVGTFPFLAACRRRSTAVTPVWFMRQAGRFLPEYRALRQRYTLLEMIQTPELAAQVTLMPRRLGVDALILFADILLPLIPMGLELNFVPDKGPVLNHPVRTAADIDALRKVQPEEDLSYVLQTVRFVRQAVEDVPLIGFAGAPFTLASYAIEGGGSRHYLNTKRLMAAAPDLWQSLMETFTAVTLDYLRAQVHAGAQAIQLFDSWVGALSPEDYRAYVLPYVRYIFDGLADLGIPRIYFGTGTAGMLSLFRGSGADVVGVDWRIELGHAWEQLGLDLAIQGNLDPVLLMAPSNVLAKRVRHILAQAGGRPGHIFNLGHGVLPQTPVDNVKFVVDLVHDETSR